eukprot:UN28422
MEENNKVEECIQEDGQVIYHSSAGGSWFNYRYDYVDADDEDVHSFGVKVSCNGVKEKETSLYLFMVGFVTDKCTHKRSCPGSAYVPHGYDILEHHGIEQIYMGLLYTYGPTTVVEITFVIIEAMNVKRSLGPHHPPTTP